MHCKKMVCPQNKLARKVSQLKSKALGSGTGAYHRKEVLPTSKMQKKLPRHKGSCLKVKGGSERKGQEGAGAAGEAGYVEPLIQSSSQIYRGSL